MTAPGQRVLLAVSNACPSSISNCPLRNCRASPFDPAGTMNSNPVTVRRLPCTHECERPRPLASEDRSTFKGSKSCPLWLNKLQSRSKAASSQLAPEKSSPVEPRSAKSSSTTSAPITLSRKRYIPIPQTCKSCCSATTSLVFPMTAKCQGSRAIHSVFPCFITAIPPSTARGARGHQTAPLHRD